MGTSIKINGTPELTIGRVSWAHLHHRVIKIDPMANSTHCQVATLLPVEVWVACQTLLVVLCLKAEILDIGLPLDQLLLLGKEGDYVS